MPAFLAPADLAPFASIDDARAAVLIEDVTARAMAAVPALGPLYADPGPLGWNDAVKVTAVRAVLRGVVLRANEAGSGALTQHQQSAGPFADMRTFTPARGLFWPSELRELRAIARGPRRAFAVDTAPGSDRHAPTCQEPRCTCGAAVAGEPIFTPGPGTWPTFTGADT